MEQSSASFEDEGVCAFFDLLLMYVLLDDVSCTLSSSNRMRLYNQSTQTWSITDEILEDLNNDIQDVVACAASGDTILISTERMIQPQRSIIISKNLTISSQPEGPLLRNRSIIETKEKVKFSCPPSGDLFVIR